ncbi:hypothetical protein [Spiroplasma endosymbiont of Polydrusus formosus]|uniref:hypothetical protein n=1 Tax=Spiroplasma endosymbiont of Polydrusus formosus TaxID=3139326 RepID=UPI0035B54BB8
MDYKVYIQLAQKKRSISRYVSIWCQRDGELANYDRLKCTTFNWIQDEDKRKINQL